MGLGTAVATLIAAKAAKGGGVALACKCAGVVAVANPASATVILGVMTGCVVTMSAAALTALIVRA